MQVTAIQVTAMQVTAMPVSVMQLTVMQVHSMPVSAAQQVQESVMQESGMQVNAMQVSAVRKRPLLLPHRFQASKLPVSVHCVHFVKKVRKNRWDMVRGPDAELAGAALPSSNLGHGPMTSSW
jgi:fumarylacetoacetate (FAA) hydrolase family protein